MKTDFIPIDYDYFDFHGRNYARIIGRNSLGKRICVIDSCDVYFWAVLKDKVSLKKINSIVGKIKKIKLDVKGRQTRVEKVEVCDKKDGRDKLVVYDESPKELVNKVIEKTDIS